MTRNTSLRRHRSPIVPRKPSTGAAPNDAYDTYALFELVEKTSKAVKYLTRHTPAPAMCEKIVGIVGTRENKHWRGFARNDDFGCLR